MEKFIVSARKYRPQDFGSVVGQQHITTTLKNSIRNNTLAHAFLFCGPRGVGKTTCARILAKTINCEQLQADGEACNTCESCLSFNGGSSLNIHELDAASNNSVEDIRELVNQVRFAPQEGKYKIYILDEVHMLSQVAFNAFLKTLEEPPPYAKFILATTEKHKIIPTILSRCQIFDFKRITSADTVDHLQEIAVKEHINAEKAALQLIAQKSEGCMRDSLSILDKLVSFTDGSVTYKNTLEHLNLLDEDYFFELTEALVAQDVAAALLLYDRINSKGFEGNTLLEGYAGFLRNLMVCKDARAAALLDVVEGMQPRYAQVAADIDLSYLVSALNVVSDACIQYRDVNNKRLHVELCLIKLCYLKQAIDLVVENSGHVSKKQRIPGPVAIKTRPVAPALARTASAPGQAMLDIETGAQPPVAESAPPPPAPPAPPAPGSEAVPPPKIKSAPVPYPATLPTPAAVEEGRLGKPSLLDKLRQEKLAERQHKKEEPARDAVPEEVMQLWADYQEKVEEQTKHATVTNMRLAHLRVEGTEVVVTSASGFGAGLLESEAKDFTELLRKHFANPALKMRVEVEQSAEQQGPRELDPKYLNSTERYKLMAAQYPMVRELKERLKLELGM